MTEKINGYDVLRGSGGLASIRNSFYPQEAVEYAFRALSESDPNGKSAHEAGSKLDSGKCAAGVLHDFALALQAVADIGTMGAKKYTRGGWQTVPNGEERYLDAMWRHLLKARHEELDPESGLPHLAHMAWNILAALELQGRSKL